MDMMRTETVRLRFGAGDPSLGAPRVVVQRDLGDGRFVDVPSPSGWQGAALDNSRHHMITHYDPIPAPNGQVASSRQHEWYVDWEIPADFPAGIHRLVARGPVWDGVSEDEVEIVSAPFAIGQAAGGTLELDRRGSILALRWQLPPVVPQTEQSWPTAGWRVHDPQVGPAQPITIRVPLTLTFAVDGIDQPGRHTVELDPAQDSHVFDLAEAGLSEQTGVITVRAHLAADIDPDPIEAIVP